MGENSPTVNLMLFVMGALQNSSAPLLGNAVRKASSWLNSTAPTTGGKFLAPVRSAGWPSAPAAVYRMPYLARDRIAVAQQRAYLVQPTVPNYRRTSAVFDDAKQNFFATKARNPQ